MVDKEQLPNLKICIDNTESDKEDGEIVSIHGEEDLQDSPVELDLDDDDRNVEFNVRIGKTGRSGRSDSRFYRQPSKVYENRSGDFVTGIDITEEDEILKKSERAKRFGIESRNPKNRIDLNRLYKSLGFHADDLRRDNRGIRLEAVHFRGVDNMHTKDIFKYFQEFGPGGVEWIDDSSCNVVWGDNLTAARALIELSRSYDEVMKPYDADTSESEEDGHKNKEKKSLVKKKQKKKDSSDKDEREKKKPSMAEKDDKNKVVSMEEDDVLDLLDEEDNAKLTTHVNGNKMSDEKTKTKDVDKEKEKKTSTAKKKTKKKKSSQSSSSSSSSSSSGSDSDSSSSSSSSSGSSSSSSGSGSSSSSSSSSGSSSSSSSSSSSDEDMETDSKDKAKKKDKDSKAAKTKSKNKTDSDKPHSENKKSELEKQSSKTDSVAKKSEEQVESSKVTKSNEEKSSKSSKGSSARDFPSYKPRDIPWPPGKWRLGLPYNKTQFLFLRYANKADKKLPGAEKRSKFYVKHGNPNYSGMKGIISNSRKRRIRSEQYREDVKEAREAIRAKRDAVTYDDVDIFGDDLKMETEETDFGTSTTDSRKVAERLSQNEDRMGNVAGRLGRFHPIDEMEEGQESLSDDDDLDLLGSDRRRFEDKPFDPEAVEMEKELEVLLKSPPKKRPMMKMHADEEEEQMKAKKRRHGGLTITADSRSGGDARSFITGESKPRHGGIDLRSKLKRNRTPSWDL